MLGYRSPLAEMQFVYDELLEDTGLPNRLSPSDLQGVLSTAATWANQELAPGSAAADAEGCYLTEEGVRTPHHYRELYQQYSRLNGPALTGDPKYGGQGFPLSVGLMLSEIYGSADWAWSLYSSVSETVTRLIEMKGTEEQKQYWLPKLYSGELIGALCLNEAQSGSDFGLLRTQATPTQAGNYLISGTKVFVSSGDHDLKDNILYLVVARTPGAASGEKGLSMFIVPKCYQQTGTDKLIRNQVRCEKLEEKMGVHGNATCIMAFDQAVGDLIADLGEGMHCLRQLQYEARLRAGLQGIALAEKSYQGASAYAQERMQQVSTRALIKTTAKTATKTAVKTASGSTVKADHSGRTQYQPIICNPDMKRLLLTQKAFAQAGRCLIYDAAKLLDQLTAYTDQGRKQRPLLMFLSILSKGFLTDIGVEASNLGIQALGGYGFLREWGMEQNTRDARMAPLHEGVTGVEAVNLINYFVLDDRNSGIDLMLNRISLFVEQHSEDRELSYFASELKRRHHQWLSVMQQIALRVKQDPNEAEAALHDFHKFCGYTVLAYYWARMAEVSLNKKQIEGDESRLHQQRIDTSHFYFARIFTRTEYHFINLNAGLDILKGI